MKNRKVNIESRNDKFTTKIKSEITLEIPSEDNPFLAKEVRTHGYNVLELMDNCDHIDSLYLLFKGELPSATQKELLSKLSLFLMNLGPRHTSARTAANAGIGRTDVNHIVPIAVMGLSGAYNGSKEVEKTMRFLQENVKQPASIIAEKQLKANHKPDEGDWVVAPGFGSDFQGQSPFLLAVVTKFLQSSPQEGHLAWSQQFVEHLSSSQPNSLGWRLAGIVAAVLLDLSIPPRMGAGIFQLLATPGAFAHGISFADKPITDMPFLPDEHYEIID